jgi:hypothetical protein
MVWRECKRTRNGKGEGSTAVNHLPDVCPRLIRNCACIYEFSMTEISCVTCVYICKRNSFDVFISFFLYIRYVRPRNVFRNVFTTQQSTAVFSHYSRCSSKWSHRIHTLHMLCMSVRCIPSFVCYDFASGFSIFAPFWTLYRIRRH